MSYNDEVDDQTAFNYSFMLGAIYKLLVAKGESQIIVTRSDAFEADENRSRVVEMEYSPMDQAMRFSIASFNTEGVNFE